MPAILSLGPILGYEAPGRYTVCCVVEAGVEPASLSLDASRGSASPAHVESLPSGRQFLRYTLDGVHEADGSAVTYRILEAGVEVESATEGGRSWTFHVPVAGIEPRLAFASCNGFTQPPGQKELSGAERSEGGNWGQWDELNADHSDEPMALLILGGNQVYSDALFTEQQEAPALFEWLELSIDRRCSRAFSGPLREQLECCFEGFYMRQWAYPAVAEAMARIPSVMMWDDHDIIDGWGSYERIGESDVMKGLFEVAERMFSTFQLRLRGRNQAMLEPASRHHSWAVQLGTHLVLGLDHRTCRTVSQVMDGVQWRDVDKWLAANVAGGLPAGVENLHILSPVPVVYRHFDKAEAVFRNTEWFRREDDPTSLEDDVRDHWMHRKHEAERSRLIKTLLDSIGRSRTTARGVRRATILSGDVHMACVGSIRSDDGVQIHQVVSSGIVHPSPNFAEWLAVRASSTDCDQLLEGGTVRVRTEQIIGQDVKFVRHRNYVLMHVRGETPTLYVFWKFEIRPGGEPDIGMWVVGDMGPSI